MEYKRTLLVTGGAGFIGSHVVRRFVCAYPHYRIINLDSLTYAGNLANLSDIEALPNYFFVKGDICNAGLVRRLFADFGVDAVIHLAAESHVDRSILEPFAFANTNVMGTLTLLQAAKESWEGRTTRQVQRPCRGARREVCAGDLSVHSDVPLPLFYHVSTDEVYGSLGSEGLFSETTPYNPHSPYSASKASSDHFVRAYRDTYQLPVVISNCSNNYGPYQFPEKLIPLCINNIKNNKPLPVYGAGQNVRDWLYVEEHAQAIDLIFHRGIRGETYNIGGCNEWNNIDLVRLLIVITDRMLGRTSGASNHLITFVSDRPGHDLRYAIDASKLRAELGWAPKLPFEEGLERTVKWYLENEAWLAQVTSGAYQTYYEKMYETR